MEKMEKGSDLPVNSAWTPLTWALWQGRSAEARQLLLNKADVNTPGEGGRSPLYCAAATGDVENAQLMVIYRRNTFLATVPLP